jgi:hypothetical protein
MPNKITWEGGGFPLDDNFTVWDNGSLDLALTDPGADTCVQVVVNEGSTVTSGTLAGFYATITLSSAASYTTGAAQVTGFACDLNVDGGTLGSEMQGAYIYIAGNTTSTLTSANICGYIVYVADLKSSPSTRAGIRIAFEDGNTASGGDAAIQVRLEGSSATMGSLIELLGTASLKPGYFLKTNAGAQTSTLIQAHTVDGTQDKVLVCNINGSTYYIPMYQAS